jgi:2'-5' RNA ligase
MYIWVGVDVENQLLEVKEKTMEVEKKLGFANSNFTLPLHISLKISFKVDDNIYQKVINKITTYYRSLKPFEVEVKDIENFNTIVWIRMVNNKMIDQIHDDLNKMLFKEYNVGLHQYDLDYAFHTTLFMDNDTVKVNKAYEMIKDVKLPSKLMINKFVVGTSKDGSLGSYAVVDTVEL